MEPSRYDQNRPLFVTGMIFLFICLILMSFTLYLLPFLLFNAVYDVPEFVVSFRQWFVDNYNFGSLAAGWIVFMILAVAVLISGWISCKTSYTLDTEICGIEEPEITADKTKKRIETITLSGKLLLLALGILVAVLLVEWLLFGI